MYLLASVDPSHVHIYVVTFDAIKLKQLVGLNYKKVKYGTLSIYVVPTSQHL